MRDDEWQANRADLAAYHARREAFEQEERARAMDHVGHVLASYRWWGLTNILNTVRLWMQAWRLRREESRNQ